MELFFSVGAALALVVGGLFVLARIADEYYHSYSKKHSAE